MFIESLNKNNCYGCSACYNICPKKAIYMKRDEEGFLYPVVDINKCINCNLCYSVCSMYTVCKKNNFTRKIYAVKAKDEQVRMKSSSGGIFSVLAKNIILNDGVVYGANLIDGFNLQHIRIDNINQLYKLRGSKYIESSIGESFYLVKKDLIANKKVLFTGTPCQIAGLKNYLKKDYENLYLIDFVCHGVPSIKVWQKYLQAKENEYGAKAIKIFFRYKSPSWSNYKLKIVFENGKIYQSLYVKDLYMKGFLKDIYLRPSCYNCKYKGIERISDATIGDFWGIDKIKFDFNDDKGIYLLVIQSKKMAMLLKEIKDELVLEGIQNEEWIPYNISIINATKYNKKRYEFFCEMKKQKNIMDLLKRYTRDNIFINLKRILKNFRRI